MQMPKIFNIIDKEMRKHYSRQRTEDVLPMLPPGVLDTQEISVVSVPLDVPGHKTKCVIRGRLDCLARFDDGSVAVIDFKTSERNAKHIPLYSRQLHAYALALENAAQEKTSPRPVTRLGLVIFAPHYFERKDRDSAHLSGGISWLEFPKNERAFREFLRGVFDVLERRLLPPSAPECPYCAFLKNNAPSANSL